MKSHSTNYHDTFIRTAEDSSASAGEVPPFKPEKRSVAYMQHEILDGHPYEFTSDDVFFEVYAQRNGIPENERESAREEFFSRGQPCFRASPLTKRYGWGVHSDSKGRVALYGVETDEYARLAASPDLRVIAAMRSKRSKD